jgi:hypothetical protein
MNAKKTPYRSDDTLASYSSKGPTAIDHLLKPDLVAPGNRVVSLLAPNSTLASEHPEKVVMTSAGARLELSGTSMAAPAVAGAAALLSRNAADFDARGDSRRPAVGHESRARRRRGRGRRRRVERGRLRGDAGRRRPPGAVDDAER